MQVHLTDSERWALRQSQKQRRDDAGYVKVTLVLTLDSGWPVGSVAEALGLDEATLYRYLRAFTDLELEEYLAHERPGYWRLLTSAQLAGLCQEVNTTRYTATKVRQTWLASEDFSYPPLRFWPPSGLPSAGRHEDNRAVDNDAGGV